MILEKERVFSKSEPATHHLDGDISRLCGKNSIPPELMDAILAVENSIIFEIRHESIRLHSLITRLDYHSRVLHSISNSLMYIRVMLGVLGFAALAMAAVFVRMS